MREIITKIVGVTYDAAQDNIRMFGCKDIGSFALVREPDNPHDKNAIRVMLGDKKLGYVPRAIAKDLAPQMDAGKDFLALFVSRNEHPLHDIVGLTVRITEISRNPSIQEFEGKEKRKNVKGFSEWVPDI